MREVCDASPPGQSRARKAVDIRLDNADGGCSPSTDRRAESDAAAGADAADDADGADGAASARALAVTWVTMG